MIKGNGQWARGWACYPCYCFQCMALVTLDAWVNEDARQSHSARLKGSGAEKSTSLKPVLDQS